MRTVPSAVRVRDINPGLPGSNPTELVAFRGLIFFAADNGFQGRELWTSDGTPQGTRLLKDINLGPNDSSPQYLTLVRDDRLPTKGLLYFTADDGNFGRELWRTDGTLQGTRMVRNINPGAASSDPLELVKFQDAPGRERLFFSATNGVNGRELWKTEPLTDTTIMVRDINPGPEDSSPTYLTQAPDGRQQRMYFRADDGVRGAELWSSDGTLAGTEIVKDIRPGSQGSNPFNLTRAAHSLMFGADDGFRGAELWRSRGRKDAVLVKDINPGPGDSMLESRTTLMTEVHFPVPGTRGRRLLVFAASDGLAHGRELWRSDGSTLGTFLVRDINPGSADSNPSMQEHPLPERRALVITRGRGNRLRKTLLFGADDGFRGGELWRTQASFASTVLVRDINPGPASGLIDNKLIGVLDRGLVGSKIYFAANNGNNVNNNELWVSNGNPAIPARTRLVRDIRPGVQPSNPTDFEVLRLGRAFLVFFAADDGLFGRELWRVT
jgi:ELWxxDGT repeat protein